MSGILVVDDDPMMLRYTRNLLECEGYEVCTAPSGAAALRELRQVAPPDAILLDMAMPEMDGIETLSRILKLAPASNVIMISGQNDSAAVVKAIKLGAVGYLTKPLDDERLLAELQRYVPEPDKVESSLLMEELDEENFFLAASPSMIKIFDQVGQIARVEAPVLITGESGTGKEIIAKLLHKYSPRAGKRFLKVNCAAIPDELLESELFGYEAGAFTGATASRPGYFEQCDGGTILLDEIGEMPPRLQAKLLQVLQEQRFFRLGGKRPVEVDVRILAATNVDVKAATEQGKLRLDLYYRLNAFSLSLPPLRERREEIAPLFRQFMKRLACAYRHQPKPLTEQMLQGYLHYEWPGNLRELHNVVKRYLVLGDQTLASGPALPAERKPAGLRREFSSSGGTLKQIVRELKRKAEAEAIRDALEQTQWRRQDAADLLGICYKALIYKSRQYGIISPSVRRKKLPKAAESSEILAMSLIEENAGSANGGRRSAFRSVELQDGDNRR